MNLIDAYMQEVGRNLPAKNHEDIEKEIRTLVEDMLDDASNAAGRAPDEAMVVEVLKKLGSPEKVAASYAPPRYLVGPAYFSTFLMVMKIVATVLLVLSAVGIGIEIGRQATDPVSVLAILGTGIGQLIGSLLSALGSLVIVFTVLQWFVPNPKGSEGEFDPRKLRVEPDPERITQTGQVMAIVGNVILLVFLNFFTRWSLFTFTGSENTFVAAPMVTDAFFTYLPFINLVLVGGLTLNVLLMAKGRWTNTLRWVSVGLHLATIALLAVILTGPQVIGMDPVGMQRSGWPTEQIDNMLRLEPLIDGIFRIALGISLVMQVIEMAQIVFKILRPRISLPAGMAQ